MATPQQTQINIGHPQHITPPEQILGGFEGVFVDTEQVSTKADIEHIKDLLTTHMANKPQKGLFTLWSAVQFICVVVFIGTNVHSIHAGQLLCEACGGYMQRYFQHLSSMTDWSHCPRQFNATVFTSELEKAIDGHQTILIHQQTYHKNPTPTLFRNFKEGRMMPAETPTGSCKMGEMGDSENKKDATFVPRSLKLSYGMWAAENIPDEDKIAECLDPLYPETPRNVSKEIKEIKEINKEITAKALNATMHSPLAEYESSCSTWVWALIVCEFAATILVIQIIVQAVLIARKYLMGCQFMQDNVEETPRQSRASSQVPSPANTRSTTPCGPRKLDGHPARGTPPFQPGSVAL